MDYIGATPQSNPIMGLLAERLKQAQQFATRPFGYQNPPAEILLNLLGVPAVQQTAERLAYGEPLTTGRGMTTQIRPEVAEAALTVAPVAGLLGKATKGLPVGANIKPVDDVVGLLTQKPVQAAEQLEKGLFNIFDESKKYHQKIPEVKNINIANLKRMNSGEVADVSDEVAANMDFSKPIQVSVFSDGEMRIVDGHHRVAAAKKLGIQSLPVELQAINAKGSTLNKLIKDSVYPQEEAMRLAQQRAALPVEQGGLGLAADNTAAERAAAMGGKEAVHFSRTGGDFNVLDSGQYAVAPFDAVGTHVGTKEAALDRFRNTVGTTDAIKGSSYPVQVLGDRPLLNPQGLPWGEDELNAFLRKTGGHNWSDVNGGKMTYQDMNKELRRKLFEEQGYTSIPYINDVEAKGAVSYIVPPQNIRSKFAAFDPFRRNEPDLLAGLLPVSLLGDEEIRRKLDQSLLGY